MGLFMRECLARGQVAYLHSRKKPKMETVKPQKEL
jgi:hypothetical protein